MTYPIPDNALDDRLGFVGTAGAGKTYSAGTCIERLLRHQSRVLILDPLGVWYGLRLLPDGKKPSPFDVVIFGGPRGDLPINEHAGALIGETCAGMKESAIIDLSELGTKAAERRFMLAFISTLYRRANKEPVHLVFDEADMFAPERLLDKEGEAAKLLGMMETIVRRGRIKGFIPWLISQRPAVLSKNVLSQVDGLASFKLTSSQDRKAIGAWVEGQADEGQWKTIYNEMPTLERGSSIVWLPAHGILKTVQFPKKDTFDSSRTPKRGERKKIAKLKPLNITALKERVSKVEADTKANDPAVLRAEISTLKKQLAKAPLALDQKQIETVRQAAYTQGYNSGLSNAEIIRAALTPAIKAVENQIDHAGLAVQRLKQSFDAVPKPEKTKKAAVAQVVERCPSKSDVAGSIPAGRSTDLSETMPGPHRKLLTVLAQFPDGRTKKQLAILAGYAHNGGAFNNPLANLRSRGWAEGGPNCITITPEGLAALGNYDPLPTGAGLREYWFANLNGPASKLLRALCDVYPNGMLKADLATTTGYSPDGGAFNNPLARLRSLELATGRGSDAIRASDDLFG